MAEGAEGALCERQLSYLGTTVNKFVAGRRSISQNLRAVALGLAS